MLSIHRRTVLALLTGVAAMALTGKAGALETVTYTEQALADAQQSGQPYLLDFFATCSTCAAQERVLDNLAAADGRYADITIIRVDWDEHSRGELVTSMAIPRRSTLVLMRGTEELGRLVAETRSEQIAALLDLAAS
jgi:hypothetical protein